MKTKHALIAMLLAFGLALSGCSNSAPAKNDQSETSEDPAKKSEGVMTYQEYMDADVDSEVVIETYVQNKQSWWEDKASLYTQDPDGAYFIYNAECSQDLYDKLKEGTKIKVTGYKTEWSGEIEVAEGAKIEILDGNYIAPVTNVTDLLGNEEELLKHQNQYVEFKDMTIEPIGDDNAAYLYNYDGSGEEGDDLYFNASKDGNTYNFVVESYLTDKDSDVYKAVKELKVGDMVDMEGYLYWYEGPNPHIIKVSVK